LAQAWTRPHGQHAGLWPVQLVYSQHGSPWGRANIGTGQTSGWTRWKQCICYYIIIIIHAFITCAHSAVILNQRCWQSLGGQHGKGADGLFERVSFQTAFEGVESGWKSDVKR